MPFSWDNMPYTNFHELNLDWFIKKFNEIFEEWESLYTTLTQWKEDTDTDLAQWKNDTLADMDAWENDLLDALDTWKRETGEDIGDWETSVIGDLNDWKQDFLDAYDTMYNRVDAIVSDTEDMVENLAEPFSTSKAYSAGDYVVYNGILYVFTADHAAGVWTGTDASQTTAMNDISDLKNAIENYNSYDVLADIAWPNHNWNGITATWDGEKYTITGTATANTNLNLYSQTNALPDNIKPGDALTFHIDKTGTMPAIHLFFYVNGEWGGLKIIDDLYQTTVPEGATGMLLRFYVERGNAVDGTCIISATKAPSNAELGEITPVVFPHQMINRTNIINAYLQKYGIVQLGAGTFKIAALAMPDNTILRGCGDSTILLVSNNTNGIIPGANCTIENLRITCEAGHTGSRGTGSGIFVQGNYDNSPYKYNTKISNVTIDGFPCAGIHGKATGYWVANSISAVNCKITNCWTGILLEDFCEFNRFTNCLCYSNYIGANLYSGNNVLSNCSLSNNTVGLYLNGTDDSLSGNNGHGAVIGCTINHSNNDTGYAAIIKGITNGFIFSGCNIWYGKILCDPGGNGNKGITFSNCIFGGSTPNITNWSGTLLLNGCEFQTTPTFAGNQPIVKANCYLFDGTQLT